MDEYFRNDAIRLYDRAKDSGVSLNQVLDYIKTLFRPLDENIWTKLEEIYDEFEMDEIERDAKADGYETRGNIGRHGEGARVDVSISARVPYQIKVRMLDDYYSPTLAGDLFLDPECDPRYVDWGYFVQTLEEEGITTFEQYEKLPKEKVIELIENSESENGNWEPGELDSKEAYFDTLDEVWDFIRSAMKEMMDYFGTLEPWKLEPESYIEVANQYAYNFLVCGKRPDKWGLDFIESEFKDCDDENMSDEN